MWPGLVGDGEGEHSFWECGFDGAPGFCDGGTGGNYIINKDDSFSKQELRILNTKKSCHIVLASVFACGVHLLFDFVLFVEHSVENLHVEVVRLSGTRNGMGDERGVVVATHGNSFFVAGDGNKDNVLFFPMLLFARQVGKKFPI